MELSKSGKYKIEVLQDDTTKSWHVLPKIMTLQDAQEWVKVIKNWGGEAKILPQ